MWPGPFFPPSDLVGTMTTKSYCLVVTASSLTGRQVPSALHVPRLRPGIRTGERTHPGLGGGPMRVRTHPDGATRGLARHPGSPGPWHDGPRTNKPKTCLPEKCEMKLAEMLPVEVFLEISATMTAFFWPFQWKKISLPPKSMRSSTLCCSEYKTYPLPNLGGKTGCIL